MMDTKSTTKPTIYVEKRDRFVHQSKKEYEEKLKALTEQGIFIDSPSDLSKIGTHFALGLVSFIEKIGLTILGLLAGCSLAHTIVVNSLFMVTSQSDSGLITYTSDSGTNFIINYGPYSQAVAITFYISFALSLLGIFNRYDLGRITGPCVLRCLSFQNGSLSMLFLLSAFSLHNAMYYLNYKITQTSLSSNVSNTIRGDKVLQGQLRSWLIMDAIRTSLILVPWSFVALGTSYKDDRMSDTLVKGIANIEELFNI